MITSRDLDYIETKLIKQGKKVLNYPLIELAEWINKEYCVNVINIHYDYIQNNRPRLGIIFEFRTDERKFYDSDYNYDHNKQKAIAEKFSELVSLKEKEPKNIFKCFKKDVPSKYNIKNIFIAFSAFEPIAKEEANNRVPEEKVQELKNKLNNNDLWKIARSFSSTTFFFYTDEQVKEYGNNESMKIFEEAYYNLIKPYDEFNYIKKDSFHLNIDSKENFDNNFSSNWYYYYK